MAACGAPVRDRSSLVSGFGAGGGAIAVLIYMIRIFAKVTVPTARLGYDDLSITIAVIYFVDELLYIAIVSLTKVSIICFYLRVFPERQFWFVSLVTLGITFMYLIAFELVSAFQCRPVSLAWTHWDGEHEGKCNNVNAQGWAAAGINIFLDASILVMPLRLVSKLDLHWKKKLQISIMLSTGAFVVVVSCLRLDTLFAFAKSQNLTWDTTPFGYWSCIEMDVGVICACMPAMYSLFKHFFPQAFDGTGLRKSKSTPFGSRNTPAPPEMQSDKGWDSKGDVEDTVRLVDLGTIRYDHVPPGTAF
ncbi:hypothetical protein H2200_010957 [Cladophialophora chaetospira]|uniref:Rhodopsin domain-containing protein n=1 Tax=Cladophialophora chaetospira TaxID=386627 RepID=A0AA38X131_9EURO|nr:hypothetical protein H2200_010957 [Cladophialophora chaetospira]